MQFLLAQNVSLPRVSHFHPEVTAAITGCRKKKKKSVSENKSRSGNVKTIRNNIKIAISRRGTADEQSTNNKHAGDSILR